MSDATQNKATVSAFITAKLNQSVKTQRQISEECGFDNPNMITMLKTGASKLPLNRVGALANALGVDPVHLLRLALSEYLPDTWEYIESVMPGTLLTANEHDLVRRYRAVTGDSDPQLLSLVPNPSSIFTMVTA